MKDVKNNAWNSFHPRRFYREVHKVHSFQSRKTGRTPRKSYCSTVVEASRKLCTLSAQRLHQIRSRTSCWEIIQILKHPHNVHLLFNLLNRNLMKLCRPTTLDMSCTTSWHTQASPLMMMLQRSAALIMPTLCMGNLVTRWRAGPTRSYQTPFRQHSKELSALSQGSSQSSNQHKKGQWGQPHWCQQLWWLLRDWGQWSARQEP